MWTSMTKHCSRCGHDSTDDALFCPRCGNSLKAASADPLIGTMVADRYILLEKIGEGRSGIIYRGEHNTLRKKVAVKILHQQLSQDEAAIERFRREATTVCEIDNDHILQVLDFGRAGDGRLFFAMELLDGEPLSKVLETTGKLPVPRVIDIVTQASEALMEAHALGYVHRDLRPRNIFLTTKRGRHDFVKLLDFGLAKLVVGEQAAAVTAMGISFGDPRYISPEQATGQSVDRRADLYSLGIMAFEMLTGAPPYSGAGTAEIIQQHLSGPIPSVRDRRSDCPQWLDHVIRRAMAKTPEKRFITVLRMHECLKAAKSPPEDGVDLEQANTELLKKEPAPITAPFAKVARTELKPEAKVEPKVEAKPAVKKAEPEPAKPVAKPPEPARPVVLTAPTAPTTPATLASKDPAPTKPVVVAAPRDPSKTIVPGGIPPASVTVRDMARTIAPGGAPPPAVAMADSAARSESPKAAVPSVSHDAATEKIAPRAAAPSQEFPAVKANGSAATSEMGSDQSRKSKKQLKSERRAEEQRRRSQERPVVKPEAAKDPAKPEAAKASDQPKADQAKIDSWYPADRKAADAPRAPSSSTLVMGAVAGDRAEKQPATSAVADVKQARSATSAIADVQQARRAPLPAAKGDGKAARGEPEKRDGKTDGKDARRTPDGLASAMKRPAGTKTPGSVAAVGKKFPSAMLDTGEHEKQWFDGDAPIHSEDEFEAARQGPNVPLIAGLSVGAIAVVGLVLAIVLVGGSKPKEEEKHRSYDTPAVSALLEKAPGTTPSAEPPKAAVLAGVDGATSGQLAPPEQPASAATPAVAIQAPVAVEDPKAIEERRLAEVKRLDDEAEQAKVKAAEDKKAEEKRLAEDAQAAKASAAEAKKAEAQRAFEEARAKLSAAEARKADEKRADNEKKAVEKRLVEQKRADAKRAADEKKAEEKRLVEGKAQRGAEARKALAEKKAEERRLADEKGKRAAEAKKAARDAQAAKAAEKKQETVVAAAPAVKPDKKPAGGFKDPFSAKAGGQADDFIKMGRQKLNGGDITGAMAQFTRAREIDANSGEAIAGLGECEFEQGDYTGAAVHLKQALRISPRKTRFVVLLGQAYFKLGRCKDSVGEYKKALKQDPRNQEAAQSLEVAERKCGGG
ncbi:MAG: tetratricopeptide repeat protein [Myxococcales bacterium]|nr:tetratricopeptide repeat protein [Myxococcales bacterium]